MTKHAMKTIDTLPAVKSFINSTDKFRVVYNTNTTSRKLIRDVMVLDSSFNPPHLGHESMLDMSNKIYNTYTPYKSGILQSYLLVLSIKNADKGDVSAEEYAHRLDMMILLSARFQNNCSVALTKESLFVNKSRLITEWLVDEYPDRHVDNYFLLGFDTLIRLFDPKYYPEKSVIETLNPFFENSKIMTFLRNDKSSGMGIEDQRRYISDIVDKKELNGMRVPDSWSGKILHGHLKDTWDISSSGIRRDIKNGVSGWKEKVSPGVAEYIEKTGMYKQ